MDLVSDVTKRLLATSPSVDPRLRKFSSEDSRSRNTNCEEETSPTLVTLDLVLQNTLTWVSSTTLVLVSLVWTWLLSWPDLDFVSRSESKGPAELGPLTESRRRRLLLGSVNDLMESSSDRRLYVTLFPSHTLPV